jgi:hypothetical protein
MPNMRDQPNLEPSPLSDAQRQSLIEASRIEHCEEADWVRLERFINNYHLNKAGRFHEGIVLSRDRMLELATLAATCREKVCSLTSKEKEILFSTMALASDERTEFTSEEIDLAAQDRARGYLIECHEIEEAAMRAACNYHAIKHSHKIDMAKYELWAYAGTLFYELVSSRKMATSRGEKDGSYGGHVGGPFVRFVQTLMKIVDGSAPTGDEVRTFVRYFRREEARGRSIVGPWTIEDGHMTISSRGKKIIT